MLDQFSRNLYRDDARAFDQDPMALVLAQEAVAQGLDLALPVVERSFLYMPYMHSESLKVHEEALRLFDQPGLEDSLRFEHLHRDILLRFGRYPHRNAVLGRESSAAERSSSRSRARHSELPLAVKLRFGTLKVHHGNRNRSKGEERGHGTYRLADHWRSGRLDCR